jgi:hypothetical protein
LPSKGCIFFENRIAKLQQTNNEVSPGCDTPVQNNFHLQHFFAPEELCHEIRGKRDYQDQDRFVFNFGQRAIIQWALLASCNRISNNINPPAKPRNCR